MQKGFLISFEGGEGSGKTVQIKRLRDHLTEKGFDVVVLREPGGTVISEQIRDVVLSAKNVGIAYTTEVLLFQAARAQLYRELVLPSLEAQKVVLMDRTRDSSVIYQGIVRGFGVDVIEQLNTISTKDTYPNLTFLLDISVEVGLGRRAQTDKMDRLDMETREFHQKVRDAYLTLAQKNDHKRWITIDAEKTIDEIADQVWKGVAKKLNV
ncbi:MAG TPA: dTMP kinase [Candidatus Pacebacteria bacterium]|nr:MAG: Thymidylate kinase [Microgenomates group bacterium GW2011_GWB1_45_17]KKU24209.1 MAG: Thymidylate kinase [Microgenomates group bacterium GW2011_GWC1_46_15]KKU24925.1 MAG: Thymidylate kinase [Microgenomates group bacterium GW2011_GWA1_46_15]HAV15321.1 dTMP kinase [Candidatus Paceibacterota bacterium]HCR11407.1 dTMP kinase [Candidatus Paceibacterota bacterium]